jgi:hypothetical protein
MQETERMAMKGEVLSGTVENELEETGRGELG